MNDSIVKLVRIQEGMGDWYFVGIARNGRVITTSRGYNSKRNAFKSAIGTFPNADIEVSEAKWK